MQPKTFCAILKRWHFQTIIVIFAVISLRKLAFVVDFFVLEISTHIVSPLPLIQLLLPDIQFEYQEYLKIILRSFLSKFYFRFICEFVHGCLSKPTLSFASYFARAFCRNMSVLTYMSKTFCCYRNFFRVFLPSLPWETLFAFLAMFGLRLWLFFYCSNFAYCLQWRCFSLC